MFRILSTRFGGSSFLHGRRGFFFEPDNGANASGAQNQGNNSANQNGNQQQQQPEYVSPLAGIDKDLLPSEAREAIEKAERELADFRGRAAQASSFQSAADRLAAQNKTYEETLQRLQSQTGSEGGRQQQLNQQLTHEQQLEQDYIEAGLAPENAKQAAKVNAKVFSKQFERYQTQQDQRYAPVFQNVVAGNAQDAFSQTIQGDKAGLFKAPEIQQKIWDKAQELAQQGQLVTPQILQNLGRIYYVEQLETSGLNQINMNQQAAPTFIPQPQQNGQQFNQGTRFSFPGAGSYVRAPQQQNQGRQLDSETMAAMGATVSGWSVKPKDYKNVPDPNRLHITRGGLS